LRFSQKQQDVFAPNFFQGLGETLVYYKLHRDAVHPAFKLTRVEPSSRKRQHTK